MDLQVLATLERKTVSLARQRHDTAAELTLDGIACLVEARDGGFAEPELLTEACECLMEAIRHHRGDPDPYIGMAYLLWLIGEPGEAMAYLSEAQALDPDNADVATLLAQIQRDAAAGRKPPPAQPQFLPPKPLPELDYDQLYDELEARITSEVQRVCSLPPHSFALSSESRRIKAMEGQYADLVAIHRQILNQLNQVEQEIDGSALRQKLKPFDVLLSRFRTSLTESWQWVQLQEMLTGHNAWIAQELQRIEALNGELPADFSAQRFEALLGDCDALADQLDALEQRGQDLSELVADYELLVQQVAQLQDLLDQAQ